MTQLRALVRSRPVNAALNWLLVAALLAEAVVDVTGGDLLWAAYGVVVAAVALAPAVVRRDPSVLVAWPVLALVAVPVLARALDLFVGPATYLSVAALALLVVVEVHAFSSAEMPPWFAVLFVVLTTLTVAALLGVAQYFSDVALGTTYLSGREELMWDLVVATAVGVGAGVCFEAFFREYGTLAAVTDEVVG